MRIITTDNLTVQITENLFLRRLHMDREHLFLLPPVERQNPVSGNLCHHLLEFIIHFIDGFLFFILGAGDNLPLLCCQFPDFCPVFRLIGNQFRQDIFGAVKCFLPRRHSFLF